MNRDNINVYSDEERTFDKPRASQHRLLAIIAIFAFLAGSSVFPILSGEFILFKEVPVPASPSTLTASENTFVCRSESDDVAILQEHLAKSNAKIVQLQERANELQQRIGNFVIPLCEFPDSIKNSLVDIRSRQDALHTTVKSVSQQIADAQQLNSRTLSAYTEKHTSTHSSHAAVVEGFVSELEVLRNGLDHQRAHMQQLGVVSTLAKSVSQEIEMLNEKWVQTQNLTPRVDELRTMVANFSCPEPILPIMIVPAPLPILEAAPPKVQSESRIATSKKLTKPMEAPPKDCILIPDAQKIVTELVTSEVELLTQNLTVYASRAVEESAAALSTAAGDAALTALRNFLEESADMSAKLVAEADYHKAQSEAKAVKSLPSFATTHVPGPTSIPELDFAQLSAGSRVVANQTSATYFPAQWRLDQRVQDVLDYAGLPLNVVSDGASEGPVRQMYELLSLHKTVGVPEDALQPSIKPGSCWPMQGQSGNLTILMQGSVLIDSVSIDHTSGGDRSSAPKDFEVYGLIDTDRGIERLIAKGRFRIDSTSSTVQNFAVIDDSFRSADQPFKAVALRVLSNHGNRSFTCLYRFRVHGIPLP